MGDQPRFVQLKLDNYAEWNRGIYNRLINKTEGHPIAVALRDRLPLPYHDEIPLNHPDFANIPEQHRYSEFIRLNKERGDNEKCKNRLIALTQETFSPEVDTIMRTRPQAIRAATVTKDVQAYMEEVCAVCTGSGAAAISKAYGDFLTLREDPDPNNQHSAATYAAEVAEAIRRMQIAFEACTPEQKARGQMELLLDAKVLQGICKAKNPLLIDSYITANVCPTRDKMLQEITRLEEGRRTKEANGNKNEDGKVTAYASHQQTQHTRQDKLGYRTKHCDKCGKNNHNTEEHWDVRPGRHKGTQSPRDSDKRRGDYATKSNMKGKSPKKLSNKAQINNRDLQKMRADNAKTLYRAIGNIEDPREQQDAFRAFVALRNTRGEDPDNDSDGLVHDDLPDYTDDDEGQGEWTTVVRKQKRHRALSSTAQKQFTCADSMERAHVDSACSHRHVSLNKRYLRNTHPTDIRVTGVTGPDVKATTEGDMPLTVPGRCKKAIVLEGGNANLLSLYKMVEGGGSFEGDESRIKIYDNKGELALEAPAHDGGWSVPMYQLLGKDKACSSEKQKTHHCSKTSVMPDSFLSIKTLRTTQANTIKQFTAEEIARADKAGELHRKLGHVSKASLIKTIESGTLTGQTVSAQDVRNWYDLCGGRCPTCVEAKMRNAPARKNVRDLPSHPGQELHGDINDIAETIGGSRYCLVAVCRRTRYVNIVLMRNKKSATVLDAWLSVIAEYNQYGHRVQRIVTDNEQTLACAGDLLRRYGIVHVPTPSGRHDKFVERHIQTLRGIQRSLLANMEYELPAKLEGELTVTAAGIMNRVTHSSIGRSPHELLTGQKGTAPKYEFGQIGLFYHRRTDTRMPAEWGMYVGKGKHSDENSLRAYLFSRPDTIYSRYKFVPCQNPPKELGLRTRLQANANNRSTVLGPPPGLHLPTAESNTVIQRANQNATGVEVFPSTPPQSEAATEGTQSPPGEVAHDTNRTQSSNSAITDTPERRADDNAQRGKRTFGETLRQNMEQLSSKLGPPPVIPVPPLPSSLNVQKSESRAPEVEVSSNRKEEEQELEIIRALRLSYRQAVQNSGDQPLIDAAVEAEVVNNILPCGHAVDLAMLKKETRDRILNSFLFMKAKTLPTGVFDRWKARLVINGAEQCVDTVGDTYAPTVNTIAVMTMLQQLADSHGTIIPLQLHSWDIAGAFVTTKIPKGTTPIYIRLPKEVTAIWTKHRPDDRCRVAKNGTMVIRLTHYLYGLRESPERFQAKLRNHLVANGLVQSKADPCVFKLNYNSKTSYIATWVDDLLGVMAKDAAEHMRKILRKEFDITEQHGSVGYIGMQITHHQKTGRVTVHQRGMIDKLVEKHTDSKTREYGTPGNKHLSEQDADSEALASPTEYRSLTMALLYLARLTRPDLLHAVTVLATRNAGPTKEDQAKLDRLMGYLKHTRDVGIRFKKGNKHLKIYADASHGYHAKGNGHGGIVITFGSAPIYCKSWKIKTICRSSSESELVALEEASTFPGWISRLLADLGIDQHKDGPTVYQDNKSTMLLAVNGGSFGRTKHLVIKKFFVRQGIGRKEFKVCYLPTKEMLADGMTKPLPSDSHWRAMADLSMYHAGT